MRQVRRQRPELVFTHDPEHPWPPHTAHHDHRAIGRGPNTAETSGDLEGIMMLPTHRELETHQGYAIYQRLPGFEYTPVMLAKIASFLALAPDGEITVFAFLYSLLEAVELDGQSVDEERLLREAVAVIRARIGAGTLGGDLTYERHGGRYVEVEQPRWWIPTRP